MTPDLDAPTVGMTGASYSTGTWPSNMTSPPWAVTQSANGSGTAGRERLMLGALVTTMVNAQSTSPDWRLAVPVPLIVFPRFFSFLGPALNGGPGMKNCRGSAFGPSRDALTEEMPSAHVPKPVWVTLRPYYSA